MAYIYKITNQINGKVYIGKTTEANIEQRWKEHQLDYKKERCKNRPFYRALNKYGPEKFVVEEVEQCDVSILEEREVYWIKYYRAYVGWDDCWGYNATQGGDGKCYCDYDWVYSLWQEGKLIKEIENLTHYDHATISKILTNKGIDAKARKERGTLAQCKRVGMIDPQTSEVIHEFISAIEAAAYIKEQTKAKATVHSISTNINRVCLLERKSAYKYGWIYL